MTTEDVTEEGNVALPSLEASNTSSHTESPPAPPAAPSPVSRETNMTETPKDGGLIVIKLRDMDGLTPDGKTLEFVLPANTTLGKFLEQVSGRLPCLGLGTSNVVYQTSTGDAFDLSHFPADSEFSVVGIQPSREKTYSLCLMKKRRPRVRRIEVEFEPDEVNGASAVEPNLKEMRARDDEEEGDDEELYQREFVGLKNQQQTCYLNSLVQSLFFCPEFRNFIYNQQVPYDPEKKSLILALQKIFLQLQFSIRTSIETEELTRTFGWKEDHNFIQHDIEELYRAVLEYLGDELKRAEKPSHGDSLFGGIMNDYVQCLQCHQRNSKLELSLGISLPVRAFGQRLPGPTLEEALRHFAQVEILSHPNQYRCEPCASLVDAEKGTSIHKLPYFLSLQLRRWEFDVSVMARRKINDRISFPFVLDMNPFMSGEIGDSCDETKFVPPIDPQIIGVSSSKEARASHSRPHAKIRNRSLQPKYTAEMDEIHGRSGPHVYQLLAVWVHEGGSSHRGHYYAYVYDLEKGSWFLCNDSFVRKSSEEEIKRTFGGGATYDPLESEKGEAYMLIYRRADVSNTFPMTWDQLPPHTRDLWTSMENEDRAVHEAEIYEKSVRRVRLCLRKGDGWEVETVEGVFERMDTLQQTVLKAYQVFHPAGVEMDPSEFRLVRFNPATLTSEESWDGREEESFGTVVRHSGENEKETLLLQRRFRGMPFDPYAPTDGVLKVRFVNWKEERILAEVEVHVPNGGTNVTVEDLRAKISRLLDLPLPNLQMAYKNSGAEAGGVHLADPEVLIGDLLANRTHPLEIMTEAVGEGETEDFLQWTSDYFDSYSFLVESQLTPAENQLPNNDSGGVALAGIRGRAESETEPQFEFDPLDTLVKTEKSCSGTEIESGVPILTSQDEADEAITPTIREMDPISAEKTTGFQELAPSRHRYFCVVSREKSEPTLERLTLRVSSKMGLSEFTRRLGKELHQSQNEFILYGVSGRAEVEYTHALGNPILRDLEPFDLMRTRIGRRLGPTEIRVPLFLLDFSEYKHTPTFLTQVVLDSGMSGSEMRQACMRAVDGVLSTHHHHLKATCLRIRKKKGLFPGRILRDTTKFRDVFLTGNGELFVQPTPREDSLGEKEFHVLIRHWTPSQLYLAQPFEVKVTHDYKEKVELLIRDEVSEVTGIGAERLEYIVPELDVDYPYELSPLILQEKVTWRKFGTARILNVHTDQCALIVRDSMEIGKELSPAERREFSKEFGEYTMSPPPRKMETGLCINLARTPPQ